MKLAYSNPNGTVSVAIAATKPEIERVLGPLSDDEYREHVCSRLIPEDAVDLIELPEDWEPPSDRSRRHLWRIRGGAVVVNELG